MNGKVKTAKIIAERENGQLIYTVEPSDGSRIHRYSTFEEASETAMRIAEYSFLVGDPQEFEPKKAVVTILKRPNGFETQTNIPPDYWTSRDLAHLLTSCG
jgi:hypothetical protein